MIQGESPHIEVFHLKSHVKITLFQTRKHPQVQGVAEEMDVCLGPSRQPSPYPSVGGLAHQLSDSIRRRTAKTTSEPGGLPGEHEAPSHHGGLQVEHETDRPLGPGQPQEAGRRVMSRVVAPGPGWGLGEGELRPAWILILDPACRRTCLCP